MHHLKSALVVVVALLVPRGSTAAAPPKNADFFRRQVAPILQRRCLSCHNTKQKKGDFSLQTAKALQDSGYLIAGKPEESHLLSVLLPADGKRAKMPKASDPLTAAEIRAIRQWIKAGAIWPQGFALTESRVTDTDWWSLRAIRKPKVPAVTSGDRGWVRTPVDAFILQKLRVKGLSPSPEADRQTLIRRLSYDLIGLPPSPQDVAAFVNDTRPDAYERLADRLLASPQYGERWARHWLDVVQYADTHGYDKDKLRPNAWPYRDYVIRAFNADKPYARFVREQIAGDVLWPGTTDGIVATGFIAAGPWDFIGHAEVPETKIDGQVARNLDRDNMVTNTMNTFCSLTIQCARCHNHKLDAVTMQHYYGLQAVFAALDRADRTYDADPQVARRRFEIQTQQRLLVGKRDVLTKQINARKTPKILALEKRIAAIQGSFVPKAPSPVPRPAAYGYHAQVAKSQNTVKWVQVDLGRKMPIEHVLLFAADEYGWADFGFPHRFKIDVSDDVTFAKSTTIADFTKNDYARPGAVPVHSQPRKVSARYVRVTATKLWNRRIRGRAMSRDWIFALGELVVISSGKPATVKAVTALDSIEALPRWGRKNLADRNLGRRRLSGFVSDPADRKSDTEILLNFTKQAEQKTLLTVLIKQRDQLLKQAAGKTLLNQRDDVEQELARNGLLLHGLPPMQRVYAGTIHAGSGAFRGRAGLGPREIFVLHRGDVKQRGEPAKPGVPPFVPGLKETFPLPKNHSEGDRRVALANWIVHRDNPLTWRSIVNRIWMHHMGRGIVASANDFGHGGELPSHPELLDWLAAEFRDNGQSLKSLHRLIVLSATYRQSSRIEPGRNRPDPRTVDSGNRLLWRMNQRRLSAEEIRDSVLAVAGKLQPKMQGPGFRDFLIEQPQHSPHYLYGKHDPNDTRIHRRTVYRFIVRSQPQPFMNTLDCADPSLSVPKRDETLTALQALAMLNNRFMIAMAEHFAERLKREQTNLADQIELAMRLTTGRAPTERERKELTAYARDFGLANTCRVIFNLNAFAFVD